MVLRWSEGVSRVWGVVLTSVQRRVGDVRGVGEGVRGSDRCFLSGDVRAGGWRWSGHSSFSPSGGDKIKDKWGVGVITCGKPRECGVCRKARAGGVGG